MKPTFNSDRLSDGTDASRRIDEGSITTKSSLPKRDHIAAIHRTARHHAVDRAADDGVGELLVRRDEPRFRVSDLRLRGRDVVARDVELPRGNRARTHELLSAFQLAPGDGELVFGGAHRGNGGLTRVFQRLRFNLAEQRADPHRLPFLDGHLRH